MRQTVKHSCAPIGHSRDSAVSHQLYRFFNAALVLIGLALGAATPGQSSESLTYELTIDGVMSEDLASLLANASLTKQLQDKGTPNLASLRRRLDGDKKRFIKVLRSQGFYGGNVTGQIDPTPNPVHASLTVTTGAVFLIEDYAIEQSSAAARTSNLPDPTEIGIEMGMAADAARLNAAEDALLDKLRAIGHPDPEIADARYVVDHDRTTVSAVITVAPGPIAAFGPLTIEGLETVNEHYIRVIADWTIGRRFDPDVLNDLRRRIDGLSLFKTIVVDAPRVPDATGRMSVKMVVTERVQRAVAVGVRISSSDEFISTNASWKHRNYFGGGETVTAEATLSTLEQEALLRLRKPQFLVRGQTLVSFATARHEDSDAYEEKSLNGFVGLERKTGGIYTTSIGVAGELESLVDNDDESVFALLGIPVSFARDTRDSTLDATSGTQFTAIVTPWASVSESSSGFVVGELSGSVYQTLGTPRVVAAARARLGGIVAGGLRDIPANKRFYTGGGSSIRGYKFREVGPLDSQNDPTGGQSVIELGSEIRILVTENIGIVPFLDGGQVYETTLPEFEGRIRWAAGLGLRYITPIGPIRLDVAFPINRRRGIDDLFQFYISIGQAF
jgi:translocation and assembly module TamA